MAKYFIETFGCQMNVHDSERMAGLLEHAGYEPAAAAERADVVVINTCSVRERAEEKLYSRLGELGAPGAAAPVVAVTGCVAQQEGAALLSRARRVDVVAGPQATRHLASLLESARDRREAVVDVNAYEDVSFPLGVARRFDPVKAYVTIIEGCNDFCAFCVVPYTRGHERMRPAAEIVAEARAAADSGRRELHLLGQIVNHYQAPDDPACDFAGLLERVHEVPGIERIRFASPHPRHVGPRLIDAIRDLPKVCKHLHLPVQSGSTRVLGVMRRRHTREDYLELVAALRLAVPSIALTTDMIVGFPGETASDFEETLSLTAAVRYTGMFSFKYSPRPNTLARQKLVDDVSEAEKTARIVALQGLQREIQLDFHSRQVGTRVEVLIDGRSRRRGWEWSGRTTGNTVVNVAASGVRPGETVVVDIRRAGPNSLWGTVEPQSPLDSATGRA